MKKTLQKLAVLILLVVLVIPCSQYVFAESSNDSLRTSYIFTDDDLAHITEPDLSGIDTSDGFVEATNIAGHGTRASTAYYMISVESGSLFTGYSSSYYAWTRYASGNSNNHDDQKWIFTDDSDGNKIVYLASDTSKCLTVDSITRRVSISQYTGSQYQKWAIAVSSDYRVLKCKATDTSVRGYKLLVETSTMAMSVSNTSFTDFGFFVANSYVPTTSVWLSNFYLCPQKERYFTSVSRSPSNATCSSLWLRWSTSNSKIAADRIGHIKGVSTGTSVLYFTDKITDASGSCTVTVLLVPEGPYFLKNKQTSTYARVKNGTMTNGQPAVQYSYDGSAAERWIINLNSDTGYYSIRSANSNNPYYYLSVSNDSSGLDVDIVIRSATSTTLTDGMKWRFSTTSSGAYKITPKTGEANDYVLSTATSLSTNNVTLLQSDYIQNSSYRDEWILVSDYFNLYVGNYFGDSLMPPILESVNNEFIRNSFSGYGSVGMSKTSFIKYFSQSRFFSCITHGTQSEIYINGSSTFSVSDIDSLNTKDINSLDFVYYGACETGKGGGNATNLVNKTSSKGVKSVLGFTTLVNIGETNFWSESFMKRIANGASVSDAISFADSEIRSNPDFADIVSLTIENRLLKGSGNIIPCQ